MHVQSDILMAQGTFVCSVAFQGNALSLSLSLVRVHTKNAQNVIDFMQRGQKKLKTFMKCSKRQLIIIIAAIRSNIYTI